MLGWMKQDWVPLALGGFAAGAAVMLWVASPASAVERPVMAPAAVLASTPAAKGVTEDVAVIAGGCFWGVEAVFAQIKGVKSVVSGYAGPNGTKVTYDSVSSGKTGFAEAVRITYDPRVVRYDTLLRVFFSVVADPTTLNYQGPDHGTHYRTAIMPMSTDQAKVARAYIAQLDTAKLWTKPIVTRVERYTGFQAAEGYHQDFMVKNPRHPYILRWDAPKLAALKRLYPDLVAPRSAP